MSAPPPDPEDESTELVQQNHESSGIITLRLTKHFSARQQQKINLHILNWNFFQTIHDLDVYFYLLISISVEKSVYAFDLI